MTTGALIYAFNNENIDYVTIAAWQASNIRRHLKIPVALVTDNTNNEITKRFDKVIVTQPQTGGTRLFSDIGTASTWYNASRVDSYDLTPWDQTLLLDADYVVASNQLKYILDSEQEFLAHNRAYDITHRDDFSGMNCFGAFKMPMWWATVVMFRKTKRSKMIFDVMQMIKNNWQHYRHLYQTGNSVYRNDHALSIALNVVNGHNINSPAIPWDLASVTPDHSVSVVAQDCYRVEFVDSGKRKWIEIRDFDFHAMGKKQLGEISNEYNCYRT